MPYLGDFKDVSTQGLETSPVSDALAGLRANEARYLKNKFNHDVVVEQAGDAPQTIDWVHQILAEFEADGSRRAYVFYESGLSINVLYGLEPGAKRAVGFKLSDGMEVPEELAEKFKFARQKSKLAGTIRGSFFVIKNEY